MNRSQRNWIFVLSLNLLPLSLITTSGVLDTPMTRSDAECSSANASGRAPASADQAPLTEDEIAKLRWQVDHCNKTQADLDVAFQALKLLVREGEYSDSQIEKIIKKMDFKNASLELQKFRKRIDEASEKGELDEVRDDLLAWAADGDNLKAIRDEEMSGADKVAELMKEVAAKYADLLESNVQRKNKAMIATLERALKIRGLSRNMSQEIRNDVATLRRENLISIAQGGMASNPQFMISYMETVNSIQADMMKSCTGWGIEIMTSCRAAQSQLTSLQQVPLIAQRADQQKQQMMQQQEQMMQKMLEQSYQVMNQNLSQQYNYVNPLVQNPGSAAIPQIQGTGRSYF